MAVPGESASTLDAVLSAFYSLDSLLELLRLQVTSARRVDPGSPATASREAGFAAVEAEALSAVSEYLSVVEDHLSHVDPSRRQRRAAEAALDALLPRLHSALSALTSFQGVHAHVFEEAYRLGLAAQRSLAAARADLASAEGLARSVPSPTVALEEALLGAELALSEEPVGLDVAQTLSRAEALSGLAARLRSLVTSEALRLAAEAEATRLAAEAEAERLYVSRRLVSLTTRCEVVDRSLVELDAALRSLRRSFVLSSWSDLEHLPSEVSAARERAGSLLERVRSCLASGNVSGARTLLPEVASSLSVVQSAARSATDRLDELESSRRDLPARRDAVRVALKTAQRLVVARQSSSPPAQYRRWVATLDREVLRLEALDAALGRPHPDYRSAAADLARVEAVASDVAVEVRSSPPRPRRT